MGYRHRWHDSLLWVLLYQSKMAKMAKMLGFESIVSDSINQTPLFRTPHLRYRCPGQGFFQFIIFYQIIFFPHLLIIIRSFTLIIIYLLFQFPKFPWTVFSCPDHENHGIQNITTLKKIARQCFGIFISGSFSNFPIFHPPFIFSSLVPLPFLNTVLLLIR